MIPQRIRKRLNRLRNFLCKAAVEIEYSASSDNCAVWIKGLYRHRWIARTYAHGPVQIIHDDLVRLKQLGHVTFPEDKPVAEVEIIYIPFECINEYGKRWWLKMWEKQPATTAAVLIAVLSLLISILALFFLFHRRNYLKII